MNMNRSSINDRHLLALILISILLLFSYWNSFHVEWQLDDPANITDNSGLHIDDLGADSLWETFFANKGGGRSLYRPLPCLTFALNWFIGKDNPFGYHVVNFTIHALTAWVLYLVIVRLLLIFGQKGWESKKYSDFFSKPESVALLAAVLWAANPIQTQAVTYIVQRMAMMAAFFYLLGMYAYVNVRISQSLIRRLFFACFCFFCFLGGIGSKENAVLMPASLLLVEWIFFQKARLGIFARPKALIIALVLFFVSLLAVSFSIYFSNGRVFDFLLNGYDVRSFTLLERTLTQPRIVLKYLSLIFFPFPDRLSIAHDITLSSSLFDPWTTLPAIIIILALIAGAIFYARRYPLLCFGVLFYFLNHMVESSVLPLELVFEHRNYLPSAFLFLPFAAGFCHVLNRLQKYGSIHTAWIGLMIGVIVALGIFTFERNKAWATPESLWRDAVLKAPRNNRAYVYLGVELAWRKNATPANFRHAMVLFRHSLGLDMHRKMDRAKTLGNMAWVYYFQGKDEKSVDTFRQAIDEFPDFDKNRRDIIVPLMSLGAFDEAESHARFLVDSFPGDPEYLNILGHILLWQENFEASLRCFRTAMRNEPENNADLMFHLGVALTRAGDLARGDWFLRRSLQQSVAHPLKQLARIENRVRAGDHDTAGRIAGQMMDTMPLPAILNFLNSLPNYQSVPVDIDIVRPVVFSAIPFWSKEKKIGRNSCDM